MRCPWFARRRARRIAGLGLVLAATAHAASAERAVTAPIFKGQPTSGYAAVVEIEIRNDDGSIGLCSGTLIAPTVVLTAGHCLAFGATAARILIFPDGVAGVIVDAARWEVDPDFDIDRLAVADVAALVLVAPIADVAPVALVDAPPRPRAVGTIVGFGDDARGISGVKRSGRVRISRCPRAVRRVGIAPGQLDGSICWRPQRHRPDTCHGDSGGPLLFGGDLAGVTSGGFPDCPGTLSWDTSVAAVRPWIDDVVARAAAAP